MNAESFSRLLANPSQLHQLRYHELRSLVLDYPWCQTLRMLLALKSRMDGREEEQADMEMAAAYAPDRSHWYQQLVSGFGPDAVDKGYVMQEDFLELKDLTELADSDILQGNVPEELTVEQAAPEHDESPAGEQDLDPEHEQIDSLFDPFEEKEQDNHLTQPLWQHAIEVAVAIAAFENTPPDQPEIPPLEIESDLQQTVQVEEVLVAPQPKSSFSSWLKQFAAPHPLLGWQEEAPARSAEAEDPPPPADIRAERSVTESEEVATETLAVLLERQGQYIKAVEIYERLSLKFPEKSAFFAQKIQQLKNMP